MKKPLIAVTVDFAVREGIRFHTVRTEYPDAIAEAGGEPVLIPCPDDPTRHTQAYTRNVQGFLFIGGRDYHPRYYGQRLHPKTALMEKRRMISDLTLIRAALRSGLPLLGVCGGCQLLSIACGGKLIRDIESPVQHQDNAFHSITIRGGRILKAIFGERLIRVNSIHHQAVDPSAPGRGLKITALAKDGTVEAVEGTGPSFRLGVQWHPERMPAPHRKQVFGALIEAARMSQLSR